MTTWTNISNASVAVGGIPSSTTVTALRDNPAAMAESASGAPVIFAGWHPVDKVTVGDGKTGLIYDAAVNGTVASVITPDFEDGYEYRIIARDLSKNSAASARLQIYGFKQTDAIYKLMLLSADAVGYAGADVEILTPRIASSVHLLRFSTYVGSDIRNGTDGDPDNYELPAQKLLRARIQFNGGYSIDGGKIWMFRRREYASLP